MNIIKNKYKKFIIFCIYFILIFYIQTKVHFNLLYSSIFIFKVKIPFIIVDFCYQDSNGDIKGYLITICDYLFNKKLQLPVIYAYDNSLEDSRFDCILNKKKNIHKNNIFQYSPPIINTIPIYKIRKKNLNVVKNKKLSRKKFRIGILRYGVLFYWMKEKEKENIVFCDSCVSLIEMLDAGLVDEIMIFKDYLNQWNYFLSAQKKLHEDYIYELINNCEIEPLYFLFNYKAEWLLSYIRKYIPIQSFI